jgi:transcription elongation factor GreA
MLVVVIGVARGMGFVRRRRCPPEGDADSSTHIMGAVSAWLPRHRWRLTSMVSETIASNTVITMLLQANTSFETEDRPSVGAETVATSRSDEVPVTVAAREALERDLASLRSERREIPARLRVAREFGDVANNDEHLAIREEEAVLAARIARLEDILARATSVDDDGVEDSVTIGSTVTVVDVDTNERLEYVIESAHSALTPGNVSAISPVGRALLGSRVGDLVSVHLPHGRRREFELRNIR